MKSIQILERDKNIRKHMHKFHLLRNQMIHFLSNFFNYIMVEVIESSWKNFMEGIQ